LAKYTGYTGYHFKSLLMPIFLHGSYNGLLMLIGTNFQSTLINVVFMLVFAAFQIWMWRMSFKRIKNLVAKDKYNIEYEYAIKTGLIKPK
jgi:hypothetical protein